MFLLTIVCSSKVNQPITNFVRLQFAYARVLLFMLSFNFNFNPVLHNNNCTTSHSKIVLGPHLMHAGLPEEGMKGRQLRKGNGIWVWVSTLPIEITFSSESQCMHSSCKKEPNN